MTLLAALLACKQPAPTETDDTDTDTDAVDTDTDTDVGTADTGAAPLSWPPFELVIDDSSGYPPLHAELVVLPLDDGGVALAPADGEAVNIVALDVTAAPGPDALVLTVAPGEVRVSTWARIEWTDFTLTLADADGDGLADGGTAAMAGSATLTSPQEGWIVSFDTTSALVPDARSGRIHLGQASLLPTDALDVFLSEPALAGASPVLSVGSPVPLELEPWRGGLVVQLAPQLTGPWLPWGAAISVDPVDLVDAAGNAFTAGDAGGVVDDPGPALDNAGFEGSGGWASRGVLLEGPPDGLVATEGVQVASISEQGVLLGEIAVPVGASTLAFDVGAVATFWDFATSARAFVVAPDGTRTPVWSIGLADGAACTDCGAYGWRYDWERVTVDVSAYAGQSVLLQVEAHIEQYLGVPQGRVCVDRVVVDP
ncbi:MAG: hypothetical protein H6737_14705 [Alphaproteobacteria bacterium]|nr:hypothetical protein [Alphaproteobacteria bacterium]